MAKRIWIMFLVLMFLVIRQTHAHALIAINEILADPATGLSGDANGDGVGSSTQDEFIELLNTGLVDEDISGWYLNDTLKTRHTFTGGTIFPSGRFLVIFGGGNPLLPGVTTFKATTGSLGLNNSNEEVFLYDDQGILVDQVAYGGEGNHDQSIVRSPDGTGTQFVLHSSVPQAQGRLFSPGETVDGQPQYMTTSTPELSTLVYFSFGAMGAFLRRKKAYQTRA